MQTWRPCDAVESAVAWKAAIERRDGPTHWFSPPEPAPPTARCGSVGRHCQGAYVLRNCEGTRRPSRSPPARKSGWPWTAAERLAGRPADPGGIHALRGSCSSSRMPLTARPCCPAMCLPGWRWKPLHADFWYKYVGLDGRVVGMTTFGESARRRPLMNYFGFYRGQRGRRRRRGSLDAPGGNALAATGDQRLWQDRPQRAARPCTESSLIPELQVVAVNELAGCPHRAAPHPLRLHPRAIPGTLAGDDSHLQGERRSHYPAATPPDQ